MTAQKYPVSKPSPLWLLVLRGGTGVVLLLSLWAIWPDYEELYGAFRGVVHEAQLRGTPLLIGYTILCLLLVAQVWPRLAATTLLLLHYNLFIQPALLSYGFDYLCATALFYCAVTPSQPCSPVPLRTIQVSLCVIYFSAGLAKAMGTSWWTGEAVWKAATLPGFEGPLSPFIYRLSGFTTLWISTGWLIIIIEMFYPILVWHQRARPYWLWATIGMHIAIAFTMALYGFSAIMILFNLIAFFFPYPRAVGRFRILINPVYSSILRLFRWRAKPSRLRQGSTD